MQSLHKYTLLMVKKMDEAEVVQCPFNGTNVKEILIDNNLK